MKDISSKIVCIIAYMIFLAVIFSVATFTNPGWLDTHTAVIDWNDGTVEAGIVNESEGSGTVAGDHTYGDNGIFYATIIVIDDDGAMDFARIKITVNSIPPSITSFNYICICEIPIFLT